MAADRRIQSKSPFEAQFGFCRALRVDDVVYVAGTAPVSAEGATRVPEDAAQQTRRCFEIIEQALADVGASLSDVVRTRMFLTDIDDWPAVGAVHGELFGDVRPVATMVQVAGLIDPSWKVEIEAEARIRA